MEKAIYQLVGANLGLYTLNFFDKRERNKDKGKSSELWRQIYVTEIIKKFVGT